MKLTKTHLKQIIKEELQKLLLEEPDWKAKKENAIKCLMSDPSVWTGDPKTSRQVAERKLSFMHRGAARGVINQYKKCNHYLCTYKYGPSRSWPEDPCHQK